MSHAIIERSRRGHRQLAWLAGLVLVSACADSSEGPGGSSNGGPESSPLPGTAALISAPTAVSVSAAATMVIGRAYVSMAPGTAPGGDSVTIEHLGGGPSVGTRMADGGFDPIAVEAEAGDTLAISVLDETGATDTTYGVVPIKGRPVIVRTSPGVGRTDVPLNSVIVVVFNEPMDSISLSDALHLQLHGVDVPGTVTGTSVGGVILSGEFVPTSPLEPASAYQLSVSTAARDLSGIPLSTPVQLTFTTAGTTAGPTPPDSAKPNPPDPPITARISAISPTSAPAGSHAFTLTITGTNFGGTSHNKSYAMWSANGSTTLLATTFVNSTHLTALIPRALLSEPGTIQVFLYTRDSTDSTQLGMSNLESFEVIGPPPPPGTGTIIVYGRINTRTPPAAPWPFRGYRDVSLDGSPWQKLSEGGSVTYSPVTPGTHRLLLSNPCTGTHEPSAEDVTAAADESVTVEVYIPLDCE